MGQCVLFLVVSLASSLYAFNLNVISRSTKRVRERNVQLHEKYERWQKPQRGKALCRAAVRDQGQPNAVCAQDQSIPEHGLECNGRPQLVSLFLKGNCTTVDKTTKAAGHTGPKWIFKKFSQAL